MRRPGSLHPGIALLLATVSLAAGYVVATTVNDIADRDVDLIDHPRDAGRPLVTGTATAGSVEDERDRRALALATAAAAGVFLGVTAVSLAIGYTYSLRPIRSSYRTWLAPAVLSVAYAVVPYTLGLLAAGGRPVASTSSCASRSTSCSSRGCAQGLPRPGRRCRVRKPTLLLAHGKAVTCAVAGIALVAGCVALVLALGGGPGVVAVVSIFAGVIIGMLRRLWRTPDRREEQLAIGLGAKMGNGLLACTLAWLVLDAEGAPSPSGSSRCRS